MACTNQQVGKLMKLDTHHTQEVAAMKAGMTAKTARKYIKIGKLPSELKKPRKHRTRDDSFSEVWPAIAEMLTNAPGLQANTILDDLIKRYPDKFSMHQLRTLQRRVNNWRAKHGADKTTFFLQKIKPGRQSQSDYTWMNSLNITISGQPYPHLLFHFMLPYSRWETVSICYSESFDSLAMGYEAAVWELGGVIREHRTDNLSAATKKSDSSRDFTQRWNGLMQYYGVTPSRNNPGAGNENGSVEKSHDLFKKAVEQQLLLRGYRDFASIEEYQIFLKSVCKLRNHGCDQRLKEELPLLKSLPDKKWYSPKVLSARVCKTSTIKVLKGTYSLPSRLIGYQLRVLVWPNELEIYYGQSLICKLSRLPNDEGASINYRHLISQLVRKPGAFKNYIYREELFPRIEFRQAYDRLKTESPSRCHKDYLKILHLAAIGNEDEVATALRIILSTKELVTVENIKALTDLPRLTIPEVQVDEPNFAHFDELIPSSSKVQEESCHA